MKNLKNFDNFLFEWIDSPGSVDVPGQASEVKVNSRNYTSANPQMPEVIDAMYEAAEVNMFLDKEGKSEAFNKFLTEKNRTGSEVTDYIKGSFREKAKPRK
jgi:hypothetical protein